MVVDSHKRELEVREAKTQKAKWAATRMGLTATFCATNGDLLIKFRRHGLREKKIGYSRASIWYLASPIRWPKMGDSIGLSHNFWSLITGVLVRFQRREWWECDSHPESFDSIPYSAGDERYDTSTILTRVNSGQTLFPLTLHLSLSLK